MWNEKFSKESRKLWFWNNVMFLTMENTRPKKDWQRNIYRTNQDKQSQPPKIPMQAVCYLHKLKRNSQGPQAWHEVYQWESQCL